MSAWKGAIAVLIALCVVGGGVSVAAAYPAFGPGCVTVREYARVQQLAPGVTRARVHRIFGARGVRGSDMYGLRGSFRAYYSCPQRVWNRRRGAGPQYWIVLVSYRHGDAKQVKATNRGYRP